MTLTTIVSNDETNKIVEELLSIKKALLALKKQEEQLKQKLYNYMNEHDVMINYETGEEFVKWTYSEGYMKFDSKTFSKKNPKIYAKYCSMTDPVRTLRIAK